MPASSEHAEAQPSKAKKDNLEAVREAMTSLLAEGKGDEVIEAAISMLGALRDKNSALMLELARLRRQQIGRRSEKVDPAQLNLLLSLVEQEDRAEGDDSDDDEANASIDEGEASTDDAPKKKARRKRPPKELPREVVPHELDEDARRCSCCNEPMPKIGEDKSELLELVPAYFLVKEHRRAKYACPTCKQGVVTAPGPAKLIDKGLAAPSLLAHVVQSKYEDHLPLNRLSRIYGRNGVDIAVSTMVGWVAAVADELEPLVGEIRARALASTLVQTDGSGIKVLDRDHPEGLRKGTMWCVVGDRRWCFFHYAQTGAGEEGPWELLRGRNGYVQADAANVFDRLYNGLAAEAVEVGCMAHARRRFVKIKDSDPRAAVVIDLVAKIYRVEKQAKAQSLDPDTWRDLRQRRTVPLLKRLKRWLLNTKKSEPPESAMAKACAYAINHWDALTRFVEDGRLGPDNNLCELQLRSLAVGRRNYLFAGSDEGARRAAILYSLLRTCALHNVECWAYLTDVIKRLAEGWPQSRIAELLPDAWAAAQQQQVTPPDTPNDA